MAIRGAAHAIYDTTYHIVGAPKYRKWIVRGDLRDFVAQCMKEIAISNEFEIEAMQIAEDHVHIFLSFPPRYSIAKVVGMLRSISSSVIFEKYPEVKEELWGGEFWEDGYFVCTVGDEVTAEIIRRYIRYHMEEEKSPN